MSENTYTDAERIRQLEAELEKTMTDVDDVAQLNGKLDKALDKAAEVVGEFTGSCPNDLGLKPSWWRECGKICKNGIEKSCWKRYFKEQALGGE